MKQILRFNKIIKSIIIAGDLCILNALFVTLYYVLDTDTQRILLSDSLPQLLVLLNLVYLLCNYSKGVVLHRRIVRADHIVMRAVRNTFCHAVVFQPYHAGAFRQLVYTLPRYILYGIPCTACIIQTHIQAFRQDIPPQGRQPSYCCTCGRWIQYGRTLRRDDRRPYFRLQGSGLFC